MSMSEPFLPNSSEPDDTLAAAEPGPGAPGTPLPERPDVLPEAPGQSDDDSADAAASEDPPFRTPEPAERLTASDLEDRV